MANQKRVPLPDGEIVTVSSSEEPWWTKRNASGYVDPGIIAPDPKNPWQRINPTKLAELHESIKARGVRQQMVVTPRSSAPWATVAPEHKSCFFLAVSGHRRLSGALGASLEAVPIKVMVYDSEKDHRMDASLLNKGQDDLSPLEEGFEIIDLQKLGWKVKEICSSLGLKHEAQVYGRISLTKLDPGIQKLLDPELPHEQRVPVSIGSVLGNVRAPTIEELRELYANFADDVKKSVIVPIEELDSLDANGLRFALQKLLLAVIKKRSLSSLRANEFIRDRTLQLEAAKGANGEKTERFQPHRRKDILGTLTKTVMGSVVMDWRAAEMARIFEFSTREEVESWIKEFRAAKGMLSTIVERLKKIRDSKKPTSPIVVQLMGHKKTS